MKLLDIFIDAPKLFGRVVFGGLPYKYALYATFLPKESITAIVWKFITAAVVTVIYLVLLPYPIVFCTEVNPPACTGIICGLLVIGVATVTIAPLEL